MEEIEELLRLNSSTNNNQDSAKVFQQSNFFKQNIKL